MIYKAGNLEVRAEQYVPSAQIHEEFVKELAVIGNIKMHGDSTTVVLPEGEKKLNQGDWIVKGEDDSISVLSDEEFNDLYVQGSN